jgi:hypothetical protein
MPNPSDTDHTIAFPILIGDIGGTNARFAILVDAYAEPKEFPVLATADFPSRSTRQSRPACSTRPRCSPVRRFWLWRDRSRMARSI